MRISGRNACAVKVPAFRSDRFCIVYNFSPAESRADPESVSRLFAACFQEAVSRFDLQRIKVHAAVGRKVKGKAADPVSAHFGYRTVAVENRHFSVCVSAFWFRMKKDPVCADAEPSVAYPDDVFSRQNKTAESEFVYNDKVISCG